MLGGNWLSGVLTGLSLLALPLALDRILSTLTRLLYAMARDGFIPEELTRTNRRSRIPGYIILILAVLAALALLVPFLELARLGSFFFLLVLMIVNFTLYSGEALDKPPGTLGINL